MSKTHTNTTATTQRYSDILNQASKQGFNAVCTVDRVTITHPKAKTVLFYGSIYQVEAWLREDERTKLFWSSVSYSIFSIVASSIVFTCKDTVAMGIVVLLAVNFIIIGAVNFFKYLNR